MYLYSILAGALGLSPVRSWVCQTTRLAGDFRVLAQEFKRVVGGGGVVFLVGEFGGLDGGLGFVAQAAVEDGQLIVGGQIVGIDGLKASIGVAGLRRSRAAGSS